MLKPTRKAGDLTITAKTLHVRPDDDLDELRILLRGPALGPTEPEVRPAEAVGTRGLFGRLSSVRRLRRRARPRFAIESAVPVPRLAGAA